MLLNSCGAEMSENSLREHSNENENSVDRYPENNPETLSGYFIIGEKLDIQRCII